MTLKIVVHAQQSAAKAGVQQMQAYPEHEAWRLLTTAAVFTTAAVLPSAAAVLPLLQ